MPQPTSANAAQSAGETPWPAAELERVAACPACGGTGRELLHRDLVDSVFCAAAGRWTLYRCTRCLSAYLDPRPSQASIGRAYAVYYTHATERGREARRPAGGLRALGLALSHGYVNARYGTRRQPSSRLGPWLAPLLPTRRQKRDAEFRFLPRPRPGQRLLDVGCGNGDYLRHAADAGWRAVGIDADQQAVDVARQRGMDARLGGIELFAGQAGCFDAITLSHVLEHVHEPAEFLQAVHRLLRPGGVVFLDTPNIQSRGARRWGVHWRGLETPRHLVIFSRSALLGMLRAAGFVAIEHKRRTAVRKSMDLASLRLRAGKSPYGREPARLPLISRLRLWRPAGRVEDDEFLTVLAYKAGP
ncbi:MAG: class I SAM-dependent methyltransferase [Xanthomonadaceae bacterium]|nr:class I SAM-dependent methyltransferase [Xanthomonadaceae bacterium]MDE2248864.1 class I SAM-dependent methyltransferase [Xanthomonadaceae bacterium]